MVAKSNEILGGTNVKEIFMSTFAKVGIGLGLLGAGGVAGYGAHEVMNDNSALTIENVGIDRVNNCGRIVLNEAMNEFLIIENDPTTAADEEYDSAQKAEAEGQSFVNNEFDTCVTEEFTSKVDEFIEDLEKPKFNPVKEEK